jgi:hypothetical protein
MADAQLTQGRARALTEGCDAQVSQARSRVIYNFPSDEARSSQIRARAFTAGTSPDMRASQLRARVLIRGRIDNRRVRAWTFSLDGHDFYVLQLGETETLVCDLATGHWAEWENTERGFWRAVHGRNWTTVGSQILADNGNRTNIVAGDDTFGILWLLDPQRGHDDDPADAAETPFRRKAMGGVAMRMRETAQCNQVFLMANKGTSDLSLAAPTVQLETSDDAEATWLDQGAITISVGDYSQELSWASLGLISAPGRAFRVTDNCLARVDGLDMR